MGILEEICMWVGNLYVPIDFMVVNTGTNERSSIIMGWPFLNTTKAIIYSSTAKIIFNIKGKREVFSFKNRAMSFPAQKETINGKNKSKK
jgi:hypothetical protein